MCACLCALHNDDDNCVVLSTVALTAPHAVGGKSVFLHVRENAANIGSPRMPDACSPAPHLRPRAAGAAAVGRVKSVGGLAALGLREHRQKTLMRALQHCCTGRTRLCQKGSKRAAHWCTHVEGSCRLLHEAPGAPQHTALIRTRWALSCRKLQLPAEVRRTPPSAMATIARVSARGRRVDMRMCVAASR